MGRLFKGGQKFLIEGEVHQRCEPSRKKNVWHPTTRKREGTITGNKGEKIPGERV